MDMKAGGCSTHQDYQHSLEETEEDHEKCQLQQVVAWKIFNQITSQTQIAFCCYTNLLST
jgi:hypothetical protein